MPQVSWSISTEWFFYFTYPFICHLLARIRTPRVTLGAIALLCGVAIAIIAFSGLLSERVNSAAAELYGPTAHNTESFYIWFSYFSPYQRISEFLLGCLIAALHLKLMDTKAPIASERLALFAMLAAIASCLFLVWVYYVLPSTPGPGAGANLTRLLRVKAAFSSCFGFAPFVGVIIFCCARYRNPIVSFLSSPLIVLGGEASFSLYMLHMMVIYAFRYNVSPITSFTVAIGNVMMWGLTMLSAIGLSLVTWRLIEVPARRRLRSVLSAPSRAQLSPHHPTRRRKASGQ
jgi:peptidoglycan/LPS O-acetylase OafA/YrhL